MTKEDRLVRLEVACGVLWLLSDGTWLMGWQVANLISGIGAIICAAVIFSHVERKPVPLLVTSASTCWLLMNVLWSVGDMAQPKIDEFILSAQVLFFTAIACMLCAFWRSDASNDVSQMILRRVRIFRHLR